MCVFVVGNVSATAAVPELSEVTWGTITEDTDITTKTRTDNGESKTINSRITTMTYKDVSADLEEHGFVTLTTKIAVPTTITLKDDTSTTNAVVRYSINGKDQGEVKTITYTGGSNDIQIKGLKSTSDASLDFKLDLTVAAAQKAISEDGYITGTYTIVYDVYDKSNEDYKEDLKENKAKPIASVTEKVIVKIEASSLTLKDTEGNEVWNAKAAADYKATLASATPAEENKTTEENKKDDVPKTGEVIYRCFGIRRRQRKRSNRAYIWKSYRYN